MIYALRLPRACLIVAILTLYMAIGFLAMLVTAVWYALDSESLREAMERLDRDKSRRLVR